MESGRLYQMRFKMPNPMQTASTPRTGRAGLSVVFVLLLGLAVNESADVYLDYRWFQSLGHNAIFHNMLLTKWLTGLGVALLMGLGIQLNSALAFRACRDLHPAYLADVDGVPQINLAALMRRLRLPATICLSLAAGLLWAGLWTQVALFLHGGTFGAQDPLFNRDIGFYVFRLPLLRSGLTFLQWLTGLSAATAALVYATHRALAQTPRGFYLSNAARKHLLVLGALYLLEHALALLLDMYNLLYSEQGPMAGASYADVHAKLPALRLYAGLAGVGAVLLLSTVQQRGFGRVFWALALQVVGAVGVHFYPMVVQRFNVIPNELEKERPYLAHNITATRAAYGLATVQERNLTADATLTAQDIRDNHATIENIRLWDHQPLLETFAQIQEIRTYYDFYAVDNDRYLIDGKLRQVMLSPRELSAASLPSRTWVNEHFTFTHGYGLTLGPVNEATPEGLPELFVQDIPPVSKTSDIQVKRPQIYFGELSDSHVFVRTKNREFDYPAGEGYVETDYDGSAGIRFDSTLMRLALASRLGSMKVLLSNDINADSRVLLHRNVTERIQRVLPFAHLDSDPYMVVRQDGTLLWICDAYLTSRHYPYAQPWTSTGLNYIRNSLKITVDAYDGTVTAYMADESDPLLQAYRAFSPSTFVPLDAMPEDVRAHLRYPVQIFNIQAAMFATYHMQQAQLLYHREDQWAIPTVSTSDAALQPMEPYYTVMRLPGEATPEFILMLPLTPKRKDNLSAWMVARSDGSHLGELVVYRFPKDRLVFGPQQIINRINQDPEISEQISLWDQRGSDAIFGTLLVIPLNESLLYVRPLYLRSEGGKIAELKRVIVAYEKRIAMEPSLQQALGTLFRDDSVASHTPDNHGTRARAPASPPPSGAPSTTAKAESATTNNSVQSAAKLALLHFELALEAQRAGDWARYGTELSIVEALLRDMQTPVDIGQETPKTAQ